MTVSQNQNNKKSRIVDLRSYKKSDYFDLDSDNNFEEDELSLIEALREDEEKTERMREEIEDKLKKEAGSFNEVVFDKILEGEEAPFKIVSSGFGAEIAKEREKVNKQIFEIKRENKKLEAERIEREKNSKIIQIEEQERLDLEFKEYQKRQEKEQKRFQKLKERERRLSQIRENLQAKPNQGKGFISFLKPALAFSGFGLTIFLAFFAVRFVSYGFQIKDQVMVKGASVVADLDKVKANFQSKNFSQLVLDFEKIQKDINYINLELEKMEGGLPEIIGKLPFISKYGSAKNFLEAGNEMAKAMVLISGSVEEFSEIENPLAFEENQSSMGDFFLNLEKQMVLAEDHLKIAEKKIESVDPSDLPVEYQAKVTELKVNFPKALKILSEFNQKQFIFKDLLGYNGHRKYLFLFQNNHEMRATGGFIGSYGILNIHDGEIKDFFIDGIFNPDGQLSARVVPPKPIQKISTNWSTHDANWYPDFPTSAEKISWFYEKTGGPTVDGIITLTPTVMKKLLKITGPIEMAEYDLTIDADNFMENIQFEVEVDYDKEENQPKKIIADLTPKILDKVFSKENLSDFPKTLQVLSEALNEKHILIYSENSEIQEMVSGLGWSGEVLKAPKDYLMVVNSNINGYKTDGVIDQKIEHNVEIESDGSIVDTVTIKRFHNGGSSEYDWWNQVNANYMRVYVPKGSELIEAEGHTRETVDFPVNYDKLGFVKDELVASIEDSIEIDKKSGTEIWSESDKTVFGNWTYVSPQEEVKVVYKYRLPFKLELDRSQEKMDSYSILYQKQSGMENSSLKTEIGLSKEQEIFWKYPNEIKNGNGKIQYETSLEKDKFLGIIIK